MFSLPRIIAVIKRISFFIFPVILFILFWQMLSMLNGPATLLPGPVAVLFDLALWIADGTVFADILASLQRVLSGFAIGSFLALMIGILASRSNMTDKAIGPIIELLRPIPPLAWIPLSILWFGIGGGAASFLVSLGAFFPVYSGVRRGLDDIQPVSIETARMFEIPLARFVTEVAIPQALPAIVSGSIVGIGVSWMIVITAELVGAQSGLGYAIQLARIQLQPERVISGMLVIGLIGFFLSRVMAGFEALLCPWNRKGDG